MTRLLPRSRVATGRLLAPSLLLVAAAALTGCSGDEAAGPGAEGDTPEDVLSAAKEKVDATSGVTVTMRTDEDPGTDYLSEATGTIVADPPAFEGTISGRVSGLPGEDIGVVSVDGTVYIDIPLLGWTDKYQPDDFCAPDPATLLDPETGVSGILTAATDVSQGETERDEDDPSVTITPYDATVPGDAIRDILPCADTADVEATFSVDGDGFLRTAELTGSFFPDADPITYRISIEEYDVTKDITAPK